MNKTILLADDDDAVRRTLGRVLESEQYTVLLAATGREAVGHFLTDPPNLVLLDLNMPDGDGWEAFNLMHRLQPTVPVVVITARPHQYAQAVERKIDAFMEKPLDLPLLLNTLNRLLSETLDARAERLAGGRFTTEFLTHRTGKLTCGDKP